MWGSDYPHDEGTHPYTKEHLRARFNHVDPVEVKKMLSENAAKLYDFDLDALRPLAEQIGPTVGEIATPIDDGAREGARAHLRRHGHPRHQVDPDVCAAERRMADVAAQTLSDRLGAAHPGVALDAGVVLQRARRDDRRARPATR